MKNFINFSFAVTILLAININLSAQNYVTAYTYINSQIIYDTARICEGDSIKIYSASNSNLINSDFNDTILDPSIWTTTSAALFTNPCPPTVLPASGKTCWFGENAYPRIITSKAIDLTPYTNSTCKISWDMKYGSNQNNKNCESPDLTTEGVHLQWSVDNGSSWSQFPGTDLSPSGTYGSNG